MFTIDFVAEITNRRAKVSVSLRLYRAPRAKLSVSRRLHCVIFAKVPNCRNQVVMWGLPGNNLPF